MYAPGDPQIMHLPPYVPKLHSSQIRTSVSGRTYESQTGLLRKNCESESQQDHCGRSLRTISRRIFHKDDQLLMIVLILNFNLHHESLTNTWLTPAHNQVLD